MKRFRSWLMLTALAVVALSGCGGKEAKETLLVYTAIEDDQYPPLLDDFKAQHPDIDVKIVRDSTGIITAKLLAEKDNPQADLVWGLAVTSLMIAERQGMLEPYAPAGLDRIAPKFRDAADPPAWVGMDAWMTAFCVNTREVEALGLPIPESFEDLLDPVYENHLVMPNPASSGTGFLTVSAVMQLMGEEAGWEFLGKLHNNMAQYTHSGSKPCKLAGSGEFPIGISFGYRGIQQAQKGEPIQVVFPSEGSGWDLEVSALIKKPGIKPGAKTFLDWAIGDSAMDVYAKSYAIVATGKVTDAEGFPADPMHQLIENDFGWAADNRDRLLEEWTDRFGAKSEAQ